MTNQTAVGLDIGNTWTNICVSWPGCDEGLVAKIPSRYTHKKPAGRPNKGGQLGKPQAFELIFTQKDNGVIRLWFGQDTLSIPSIQKLDMQKYNAAHIQILAKAVLSQWETTHKRHGVDLSQLGQLNIVASMPPGLFEDSAAYNMALKAYKDAFNKSPQSHPKIKRPGKPTVQIVTRFNGLVQEAVHWGEDTPRKGEWILVIDLGGGTRDWALFNGSDTPLGKGTSNNGLLDAYAQINPLNPAMAELEILRNKKKQWQELTIYFSDVEMGIQQITRKLPYDIDRLYIIGGGASLMPNSVQQSIKTLAPKVIFKDEYTNCRANWLKAGGK
jgi:hypothetical protein